MSTERAWCEGGGRRSLLGETRLRLVLELARRGRRARRRRYRRCADAGLDEIEPRLGQQHSPGREHAGARRDDDHLHAQLGAEGRRVHGAAAAAGDEHEVARVVAAPTETSLRALIMFALTRRMTPFAKLRLAHAEPGAQPAHGRRDARSGWTRSRPPRTYSGLRTPASSFASVTVGLPPPLRSTPARGRRRRSSARP